LQKLLEVSATTYQKIRVYLALIPARLDYSQNLASIPQESWVACRQELDELISLLLTEKDYVVQDVVEEYDDMVDREPETVDGKVQRVKVAGSIVGLVENLDNEVSLRLVPSTGCS
jgi:translation initiation factor 3 subunit C